MPFSFPIVQNSCESTRRPDVGECWSVMDSIVMVTDPWLYSHSCCIAVETPLLDGAMCLQII